MSNFNEDFNIIVSAPLIGLGNMSSLLSNIRTWKKTSLLLFLVKLLRTLVSSYFQLHKMLCLSDTIL